LATKVLGRFKCVPEGLTLALLRTIVGFIDPQKASVPVVTTRIVILASIEPTVTILLA